MSSCLYCGKRSEVGHVQRIDLRLRLLQGRSRREPAQVLPVVAVARGVGLLGGGERQRPPQHHIGIEEREVTRHDADHRVGLSVNPQLVAQDLQIAAELALPQRVAQHHFLLVPDFSFLVGEGSPERRRYAEQAEERRGDVGGVDADRRAVLIDAEVAEVEQRLVRVGVRLAQPIVIVRHTRATVVPGPGVRIKVLHHDDTVRFRNRQRAQQDAVDHREEGRVGADADGERQRGRERERCVLPEKAQAKAQVLT